MRVLLNLATLKNGGGQNVGLNFIRCLLNEKKDLSKFLFVAANGSAIESELVENNIGNRISVPNNALKRMLFEVFNGKNIVKKYKIDIIYTMFGIGLYPKSCAQVSGSADSNIFFPEIDFWKGYKGLAKVKRKLVDKYRIYALKRADAVVFENEAILNRSKSIYNLKCTFYSKPSISQVFKDNKLDLPNIEDFHVGLFLCGWQPHKNFMIIPELLKKFKDNNINFKIILTAPLDYSKYHLDFESKLKLFEVEDYVIMPGTVNHSELKDLYSRSDFIFLLSKLESFSNNIIESWFFKKVLVITDAEWSISICKESACYVQRNSADDIFAKVNELIKDIKKQEELISISSKLLLDYPTIEGKVKSELQYLKKIYQKYN